MPQAEADITQDSLERFVPPHLRRPKQTLVGGLSTQTSSDTAPNLEPGSHVLPHIKPPGKFFGNRESPLSQISVTANEAMHRPSLPYLSEVGNSNPANAAIIQHSESKLIPGSAVKSCSDLQHNPTGFQHIKEALQGVPTVDKTNRRGPGSSEFLDLPAEIRMIVYQYALGGRLFHIEPQYRQVPSYPGSRRSRDQWYGAFAHRECKLRHQRKPEAYHRYCFGFPRTTNAVSLLYTCRFINREAAFVPYSWNTFSFRDLRSPLSFCGPLCGRSQVLTFASSLTHGQRRAVQTIQFSSLMNKPTLSYQIWDTFCARLDASHGLPCVAKIYLELLIDYDQSTTESHLTCCLEQIRDMKLGHKNVVIQCQKRSKR